ncbi:DUF2306 domain-containing protein [Kiritimatiellota bacterium B12222]|nr:DUF2306 domain-containing protein [Kiritimatiellota bacterium B12222]
MHTKAILYTLFWTLVLGLTGLLLWNSRGYVSDPETVYFFRERIDTSPEVWKSILIPHVMAGMICLLAGPLLFLPLIKNGRVHAGLGILYALSTLGVMLPTGIWLSFYAHGGWIGRLGFLITGSGMFVATILGLWALRDLQIVSHRHWMMRSYALALSALSFRIVYVTGYTLGLSYEVNYPLSTWLSTVINLVVVEIMIRRSATLNPHPHGERPDEKNHIPHTHVSLPVVSVRQ